MPGTLAIALRSMLVLHGATNTAEGGSASPSTLSWQTRRVRYERVRHAVCLDRGTLAI
jgi:hypothetical protein